MNSPTLALHGGPRAVTATPPPYARWGAEELARLTTMVDQKSLFYWNGPQTGALLAGAGARQRERALAARLQAPGAIRDRLLQVLPADATGTRLEIALDAATSAQRRVIAAVRAGQLTPAPPVDLIAAATAQSVIDPSDAERLRSAYNLADDLLQARASVA